MFDIDDFKGINDKFGHQIGDEVLIKLTKEVKKCINKNDIIGRYGGEEFIVDQNGKNSVVKFTKDLDISITGQNVLLVEDVVGTGFTLGYIYQHLESYQPASLKICTLLDSPDERLLTLPITYRCFIKPDTFVVGYGLDYKQQYRNLPYIAEYRR